MKKATINYLKSIWFKIMNDEMSQNEAIVLFLICLGISYIGIHLGDATFGGSK